MPTAQIVKDQIQIDAQEGDFLSVRLEGDMHHSMYVSYKKLPALLEFDGLIYGKISWNSDWGMAYYKVNPMTAKIVK